MWQDLPLLSSQTRDLSATEPCHHAGLVCLRIWLTFLVLPEVAPELPTLSVLTPEGSSKTSPSAPRHAPVMSHFLSGGGPSAGTSPLDSSGCSVFWLKSGTPLPLSQTHSRNRNCTGSHAEGARVLWISRSPTGPRSGPHAHHASSGGPLRRP